jgi:hypothetical protein
MPESDVMARILGLESPPQEVSSVPPGPPRNPPTTLSVASIASGSTFEFMFSEIKATAMVRGW